MQLFKRVGERLDPYLILLLVLSGLALTPLFAPGYFYTAHDGRHSVFYLNMFDASIRDGALWPRWAMHHIQGYGYPTFIIQSPLGFYVAEIFMLLGAGWAAFSSTSPIREPRGCSDRSGMACGVINSTPVSSQRRVRESLACLTHPTWL